VGAERSFTWQQFNSARYWLRRGRSNQTVSNKIAGLARGRQVNVSISSFVPKPHTPFQWEPQESAGSLVAKQLFFKRSFFARNIRLKWHSHHLSQLEGVFARGDRRLASVLEHAVQQGAGFEGWTEHFNPALWDAAFAACSLDREFYLRRRGPAECLPWSHISCGVTEAFLGAEREKAFRAETTPDCRQQGCHGCGACPSLAARPELGRPAGRMPRTPSPPANQAAGGSAHRYRLWYDKKGPAAFLSHLEWCGILSRALRRARLPLKYSQGFHPLPRIIVHEALPVGIEADNQTCDIELRAAVCAADLPGLINPHLPAGLSICSAAESTAAPPAGEKATKKYAVRPPSNSGCRLPTAERMQDLIAAFHKTDAYVLHAFKKGNPFETDLKQLVSKLTLTDHDGLELEIRNMPGRMPQIPDILGAILQLGEREKKLLKIIKL